MVGPAGGHINGRIEDVISSPAARTPFETSVEDRDDRRTLSGYGIEMACLARVSDPQRLAAVARYGGVGVTVEDGLGDIVRLATRLCGTGVALISLFDAERQVFRACLGLSLAELPASKTICTYTLSEQGVMIVPDLARDPRMLAFDFVSGPPHMRFYAGTPLLTDDGFPLGTLCVLDPSPRPMGLDPGQVEDLLALARLVVVRLDQVRIDQRLRQVIVERDALLGEISDDARRESSLLALGDAMRETADVPGLVRIAARTLCETIGLDRAGYAIVGPDGDAFDLVADWCGPDVSSIVGQYRIRDYAGLGACMREGRIVVIEDVTTDPLTASIVEECLAIGVRHMVVVPIVSGGSLKAAFCLHHRQALSWTPAMLRFAQTVTDRTSVAVARASSEARQRILNQEIGHRMKNLLALVQSIAQQTLRSYPGAPTDVLMARYQSLGAAHEMLLVGHLASGDLSGLIRTVLSVHIGSDAARLITEGPSVQIPSQIALSLALILHELGTNATKYGAWSNADGAVRITWGRDPEGRLRLDWREAGGPPVMPPAKRGFGSRLIERGLFGAGTVRLDYEPGGVYCCLDVAMG